MKPKQPAPSDTADKFMLRFPDGMRDRIREEAENNNRSMNAEIIARLASSFDKATKSDVDLSKELAEMKREIRRLLWGTRLTGRAIEKAAEGDRSDLDYLIGVAKEMPLLLPITEKAEQELEQEIDKWMQDEANAATPTKAGK